MNEEKGLETKIAKGFEKIGNVDVPTPDIMYFNELVKSKQASLKKRQNLQFAVFIIFSIIFVSYLFSLMVRNTLFFITLQAVALVCPLIWFLSTFLYKFIMEARLKQ